MNLTDRFCSHSTEWCNPENLNLFTTEDFASVIASEKDQNNVIRVDEFLRPVCLIGGLNVNEKCLWILLSSIECNHLLPTFRKSKHSKLLTYRPRTSEFQWDLLNVNKRNLLQVTEMDQPLEIDLKTKVAIEIFAGSICFENEAEQEIFCEFVGFIPEPRSVNRYIVPRKRFENAKEQCRGKCSFDTNSLVTKLIVLKLKLKRNCLWKEITLKKC